MGMVRNLTKNFFAILHYNTAFAVLAVCGILVVNLGPFVGVWIAHGWAQAGFIASLVTLIAIYVGMARRSDISPLYVLLHPIAYAAVQLRDCAVGRVDAGARRGDLAGNLVLTG